MGTIYFIRHGETVANEQNYFAGKMDVELTELGKSQARQAGLYLQQRSLKFDEVHVSTLKRAQETAQIALSQSGQENIPTFISEKLMERDFGEFTTNNKNLLRKTKGYTWYEDILHSPDHCPLDAESFHELYGRVEEYYRTVLRPRADSGKDILVVSHKYVVEMLALILARKPLDDYFDFRLPNGKPLNESDVSTIFKSESKLLKHISDLTLYSSSILIMLGFLFGGVAKTIFQTNINENIFIQLVALFLAGSTFFVMLGVNSSALKNTFSFKRRVLLPWLTRIILAGAIWLVWPHEGTRHAWLLLMMPPALTAPVSSLLWGGTLHLATSKTVLLSILAPLYLAGIFWIAGENLVTHLLPFTLILIGAVFLPTFLAQIIRAQYPIQAGKTADRWKWLGVICVMFIAFLCGYRFTPQNLLAIMEFGGQERDMLFADGVIIMMIFTIIKGFSHLSKWFSECTDPEKVDIYVTHSTPNIFLWISLLSLAAPGNYAVFWANIFFFLGIFLDECQFIQNFAYGFNRQHKRALTAPRLANDTSPKISPQPALLPITSERIMPIKTYTRP